MPQAIQRLPAKRPVQGSEWPPYGLRRIGIRTCTFFKALIRNQRESINVTLLDRPPGASTSAYSGADANSPYVPSEPLVIPPPAGAAPTRAMTLVPVVGFQGFRRISPLSTWRL